MKAPIYSLLVRFANWFAWFFRQEVTIFDRVASWFEVPTDFEATPRRESKYHDWHETEDGRWGYEATPPPIGHPSRDYIFNESIHNPETFFQ